MATGGNIVIQMYSYKLTSDILLGFISDVKFDTLTSANIVDVISNSIVSTVVRVRLEDKIKTMPEQESMQIFATGIGFAAAELGSLNTDKIDSSMTKESFIMAIIEAVLTKLPTETDDPLLADISEGRITIPFSDYQKMQDEISQCQKLSKNRGYDNRSLCPSYVGYSSIVYLILIILCIYFYMQRKKY